MKVRKMKKYIKTLFCVVLVGILIIIPKDNSCAMKEERLSESIFLLESNLEKNSSSVENEINKAVDNYHKILKTGQLSSEDKNKIIEQIEELQRQLSAYKKYKSGIRLMGKDNQVFLAAISSVNAYFLNKGYLLSSELLTHSTKNNKVDSIYRPYNNELVKASPVFRKIKIGRQTHGSDSFPNTGSRLERDLYYSIHSFRWTKKNYMVTIMDRYDFAYGSYSGLAGIAVNTMYLAQQAGVVVPFQLRITK